MGIRLGEVVTGATEWRRGFAMMADGVALVYVSSWMWSARCLMTFSCVLRVMIEIRAFCWLDDRCWMIDCRTLDAEKPRSTFPSSFLPPDP